MATDEQIRDLAYYMFVVELLGFLFGIWIGNDGLVLAMMVVLAVNSLVLWGLVQQHDATV
jgi:hypothetical protein